MTEQGSMAGVVILVTSNRGAKKQTMQSIENCRARGAICFQIAAGSDVTLARNLALSAVWRAYRDGQLAPRVPEVLLLVDDDMVFELEAVAALIEHARTHGEPASAMYATMAGTLAATRVREWPGFWLAGLGLLAIPWKLFAFLVEESQRFTMGLDGLDQWAFTSSTWRPNDDDESKPGQWMSEDYTLCRRMGGVRLLPVAAGHLKEIPLWPDDETIAKVRDGAELESYREGMQIPKLVSELEVSP